jgi:hypothetical protein
MFFIFNSHCLIAIEKKKYVGNSSKAKVDTAGGVIKTERVYQDRDLLEKDWDHKGFPSVEAELLLMEEYLLKARTALSFSQISGLSQLKKLPRCPKNNKVHQKESKKPQKVLLA